MLLRAIPLLLIASASLTCSEATPDPEVERLEKACDARMCPDPLPEQIDCMPIVPDYIKPLCEDPCYSLFVSCGVKYGS